MDTKPLNSKWLVVGIILLFIGVTIAPTINANNDTLVSSRFSTPAKEEMISIAAFEYKADGSIVKSIVKMSRGQIDNFRAELKGVKDTDIQLSIYKKYNLIPENITSEKLYEGMEEKSLRMGLTKENLERLGFIEKNTFSKQNTQNRERFFYFNMKCMIEAEFIGGIALPLGLSFFTLWWSLILCSLGKDTGAVRNVNIFDIRDTIITVFGGDIWTENGPFDFYTFMYFSLTKLIGFVGYFFYSIDWLRGLTTWCIGSVAYVRIVGMPPIPYP